MTAADKQAQLLRAVEADGPSMAGLFRRAFAGKGLRNAINAKCAECCWLDRAAIRNCTAADCPLWAFRPYQVKRGAKGRKKRNVLTRQGEISSNPTQDTASNAAPVFEAKGA